MQERRGAAIAITDLRKEYGEGRGRVVALDGINLAIAATALEHGLAIATRNVSDFAATGAALLDPFEPHP